MREIGPYEWEPGAISPTKAKSLRRTLRNYRNEYIAARSEFLAARSAWRAARGTPDEGRAILEVEDAAGAVFEMRHWYWTFLRTVEAIDNGSTAIRSGGHRSPAEIVKRNAKETR